MIAFSATVHPLIPLGEGQQKRKQPHNQTYQTGGAIERVDAREAGRIRARIVSRRRSGRRSHGWRRGRRSNVAVIDNENVLADNLVVARARQRRGAVGGRSVVLAALKNALIDKVDSANGFGGRRSGKRGPDLAVAIARRGAVGGTETVHGDWKSLIRTVDGKRQVKAQQRQDGERQTHCRDGESAGFSCGRTTGVTPTPAAQSKFFFHLIWQRPRRRSPKPPDFLLRTRNGGDSGHR
jgi:hypothetical protein